MKRTLITMAVIAALALPSATAAAGKPGGFSWAMCLPYKKASLAQYAGESVHEYVNEQVRRTEVFVSSVGKGKVCFQQLKPYQKASFLFAFRIADGTTAGYIWIPFKNNRTIRVTLPASWLD